MRSAAVLLFCGLLHLFGDEPSPIIIPAGLNHGRIILTAHIGDSGPLTFLLDSACTIPTLHPDLVDELKLTASGRVRINGIAGEERAPTFSGVRFDLSGASYSPRRVASIPSERDERRRHDGVLDAGFFRRFVVELQPESGSIRLYAPTNFSYSGNGTVVPFRFKDEIPVVTGAILLPESENIPAEFEIDTGCDSGVCLGAHFVQEHDLLHRVENRSGKKFGVGGSVETRIGRLPALLLGGVEIKNVQTDFFQNGSPVDEPLAGHIGMGVLGKRKVIFDYTRKHLIIEEPTHSQ